MQKYPSQADLTAFFSDGGDYLIWISPPDRKPFLEGRPAGCLGPKGYHQTCFLGKSWATHRLLWIFRHGDIPDGMEVDHRDGNRLNNKDYNLRLATVSQNKMNMKLNSRNTTGVKGVRYDAERNKYRAGLIVDGKNIHIGRFNTLEEAAMAVRLAREEAHGEFCNHGD